jgi:hypothetical protein
MKIKTYKGDDLVWITNIVNEFLEANPDIEVKDIKINTTEYGHVVLVMYEEPKETKSRLVE